MRVKVAAGANSDAGRIQLTDGAGGAASTLNGGPQGTGWYTVSVALQVSAAATYVRLNIYADAPGDTGTADIVYVDRITVSDGLMPLDAAQEAVLSTDLLRTDAIHMGDAGARILAGTGTPNGAITAPKSSIYLRADASAATNRLYVNTDGGTTWTYIAAFS